MMKILKYFSGECFKVKIVIFAEKGKVKKCSGRELPR